MDVVAYAAGTGRGHTTRVVAVLRRLDAECMVVTTQGSLQPLEAHGIPWLQVAPEEAASTLDDLAPRMLVIDCFPHGQSGELSEWIESWPGRKVLLWQRLPSKLATPLARPDGLGYDRVLVVEGGGGAVGIDCEPVLLRDADELLPRDEARAILGVGEEPAVVAVIPYHGTGAITTLLDNLDVAVLRPAHYPLLELMNGVDALIGTAGYSLFHEARACGVPARWTWTQGSNDQALRCPHPVRDPAEVSRWAAGITPRHGARAEYVNGAAIAAWHIERLLR